MPQTTEARLRRRFIFLPTALAPLLLGIALLLTGLCGTARADAVSCGDEDLHVQGKVLNNAPQPDLLVKGACKVVGYSPFYFGHVNIVSGGKLIFVEPPVEPRTETGQDFWASSIIIENGGALLAGVGNQAPYGTNGKTLTIHLYGADPRGGDPTKNEGPGVSCVKVTEPDKFADCGIPKDIWESNGKPDANGDPWTLPGGVKDFFYTYGNLHGDSGTNDTGQAGHFGYKMLALSYGGTLQLHGLMGTSGTSAADITTLLKPAAGLTDADTATIIQSGTDWGRLAGVNGTTLTLDRAVGNDWKQGAQVVVTSTDFLPEHAEVREIASVSGDTVTLTEPLTYPHNATAYNVADKIGTQETAFRKAVQTADGTTAPPILDKAETRAAVGLLTRSIRIVSEGDSVNETFAQATARNAHYMYGGHVVFRQGFAKLQIQGVEFRQLGQGGLMGRYPVHFHIARQVPADTYVIDSAINESMTRWVVIHSTLGVTIARDVGYKSIGHGFFLEDGTETDNKFYADLGVYARASVQDADNPRNIPGLLDARNSENFLPLKYHSDAQYPTVFWITNGWNALAGNMAAGAGTCGACYWYVPAGNHDMMDIPPSGGAMMTPMKWSGYSAIQADPRGPGYNGRAGISPVQLFYRNSCSTAQHSLSVTDGSSCTQVSRLIPEQSVKPVPNLRAPDAPPNPPGDDTTESADSRMYYPRYSGLRKPAVCDPAKDGAACFATVICDFANPTHCYPSVFSHYTSSFNWAESNFSAIWLRSSYLLLDHAFLSDVLGPGVTMVTGGDYTRANLPVGYWGVTANSIFAGSAQQPDDYNRVAGLSKLCDNQGGFCVDKVSGVAFPLSNWGVGQRLYNVYDGPAYQDADAFLDVHPEPCPNAAASCMYFNTPGVRVAGKAVPGVAPGEPYIPNAAIAWKQSNGFYYPPTFHSRNLFFGDVDLRHYVIEPTFYPGTYRTDTAAMNKEFKYTGGNFSNYTDVDRQTELSDDDGSLTGFDNTISVNEDPFFTAPVQTAECRSGIGVDGSNACAGQTPPNTPTARTSPYDHISTVLYPDPATLDPDNWKITCTNETCTGVPIYRQYLTGVKGKDAATSTREWATWMQNGCDAQIAALWGKTRSVPATDPYVTPPPPNGQSVPLVPLTPADPFWKFSVQCPSPFVRMAGMALNQRSVLTVNNGSYYIDTTVSRDYQQNTWDLEPRNKGPGRNINVFQGGKSYLVFLLFAKPTTKQTYQIYGGAGFTPGSIAGVQVDVSVMPLPPTAVKDWEGAKFWTATPDPARDGVVDITIDMTKLPKDLLDPKHLTSDAEAMDETCQPHTYCSKITSGTTTTCGCDRKKLGVLGLLDPKYENVCDNICSHWAVKDLDCPKGGCLGFKFTLPGEFVAKDQFERPAPTVYPADPWDAISFLRTGTLPDKDANAGGCHYTDAQIPNDKSACKVAN
jgi:hypothetical protein